MQHELKTLFAQRLYGLVQGYEDIKDYDELHHDRLFGVVLGIRRHKVVDISQRSIEREEGQSKEVTFCHFQLLPKKVSRFIVLFSYTKND